MSSRLTRYGAVHGYSLTRVPLNAPKLHWIRHPHIMHICEPWKNACELLYTKSEYLIIMPDRFIPYKSRNININQNFILHIKLYVNKKSSRISRFHIMSSVCNTNWCACERFFNVWLIIIDLHEAFASCSPPSVRHYLLSLLLTPFLTWREIVRSFIRTFWLPRWLELALYAGPIERVLLENRQYCFSSLHSA
jgi:hypothetical protein